MDILALHRQGLSIRKISERLHAHRETVKKYIEQGSSPPRRKAREKDSILAPYLVLIDEWLREDNFKATWIFQQLKNLGYGGGYDTVKRHVSRVKDANRRQAFIRFETVPGLQGQMDWADFQVAGGETVFLFVLVLGFSRAMYAELVPRCTLEVFMDAHIRAFRYLGGTPLEMLYDNMKHVVIGRNDGQPAFNVEFDHFARHYGFKPVLCPPYSPWVKGKVERPVDYIRENFWRGYVFTGIEQANRDLLRWLTETANQRTHGTHHQKVDVRWRQELSSLAPCPSSEYDTSIKVFRKVYKDCMISYEASRYQVPPDVVGKRILLKVKDGVIRFFDDGRLLVTYDVCDRKGGCLTDAGIMDQIRQRQREHRHTPYGHQKGKATRGLIDASLYPQVLYRPLSVYDRFAQGGALWNN